MHDAPIPDFLLSATVTLLAGGLPRLTAYFANSTFSFTPSCPPRREILLYFSLSDFFARFRGSQKRRLLLLRVNFVRISTHLKPGLGDGYLLLCGYGNTVRDGDLDEYYHDLLAEHSNHPGSHNHNRPTVMLVVRRRHLRFFHRHHRSQYSSWYVYSLGQNAGSLWAWVVRLASYSFLVSRLMALVGIISYRPR